MPMDLSTNLNPKESKVEATLMGATLNLLSQSGALVIVLNENQAIDLRAGLERFREFKSDSIESPVLMGQVMGAGTPTIGCARVAIRGVHAPDCQVSGVSVVVDRSRLLLSKGMERTFIQLMDSQAAQVKAEIADLGVS